MESVRKSSKNIRCFILCTCPVVVSDMVELMAFLTDPAHVAETNPSELWRHDFFWDLTVSFLSQRRGDAKCDNLYKSMLVPCAPFVSASSWCSSSSSASSPGIRPHRADVGYQQMTFARRYRCLSSRKCGCGHVSPHVCRVIPLLRAPVTQF